jgi:hypothetical protein
MKSKAIIATIVLLVASMFVAAVSAQNEQVGLRGIDPIRGIFGELMRVTTDTTGLTVEEITEQIGEGATLGEVISNNGGDVETVISSVLATVSSRLQEQVDADKITQALSEQLQATVEQYLRDLMNNDAPIPRIDRPNNRRGEQIEMGVFAEFVRVITETTGLTVREILEQVDEDTTLADIIEANGADVNNVVDSVLASLSTRLQEQLDAGNITAEQMSSVMDRAEQRLTDWINGDISLPRMNKNPGR